MKPLYVLIGSFVIALPATWLLSGNVDYILSGNIALCIMLCFTGIGHFVYHKGMTMMLPRFMPFKTAWVYATGALEWLLGLALLIGTFRSTAAAVLIAFFILILPANIYAALKKVDYQKGTLTGPGTNYLWFRIPLQLFFMVWAWYFGVGL